MCGLPRYYAAAEKFGWSVRDRNVGKHPRHAMVAYIAASEAGSMGAAQRAAVKIAERMNAGADTTGG